MTNNNNQNQQTDYWICTGEEKKQPHPPQKRLKYGEKCPLCHYVKKIKRDPGFSSGGGETNGDNGTKTTVSEVPPKGNTNGVNDTETTGSKVPPQPKNSKLDWPLVGALTILNVGSGFTTIRGAAQLLPNFVAYPMGATIQGILFALISRFFLKHHPLIKWIVVGCFSTFSVYTSFFAYDYLLTGEKREKERIELANSGHKSLVGAVFTPIKHKVNWLETEIEELKKIIDTEKKFGREGRPRGCGPECQKLQTKQEKLEKQMAQVESLVNRLNPFFNYNLEDKSPREIFAADLEALSEVGENCLPKDLLSELEITCLPDKYLRALKLQDPEYKQLRSTYIDPDLEVGFVTPILKVRKGESSAIAAAIMALLIDGCIILLGIGVEIRQQGQTLILHLKDGKILEFLYLLQSKSLNAIIEIGKSDDNKDEYQHLLSWLSANTQWISILQDNNNEEERDNISDDEYKSWQFRDPSSQKKFQKWLGDEINRLNRLNRDRANKFWNKNPQKYFKLEMPRIPKDKD